MRMYVFSREKYVFYLDHLWVLQYPVEQSEAIVIEKCTIKLTGTPGNPFFPDVPGKPGTPFSPGKPGLPGIPGAPLKPGSPFIPCKPGRPGFPFDPLQLE